MAVLNRHVHDGEPSINCSFPFQVAFADTHARWIEVANYCSVHSMPFRSRWDMRGHFRYCFAAATFADDVADTFGGERVDFAITDRSGRREVMAPGLMLMQHPWQL